MGFRNLISFDDKDISTEYSSLMSKVVASGNDRIKFPINEPAKGQKKSQIDEYLEFYRGPGVQHLAIATNDIVAHGHRSCATAASSSYRFLRPTTTRCSERVGKIDEDLAPLKELGILVDRDDEGYLLQIFTKPVEDRPTLFYEIIQRKGATQLRQGQLQGAVRSDRAGAGAERESVK